MRFRKTVRGAVVRAAAVLVAGGALGAAALPAQAYSPDPTVHATYRNTSNCPCSGGALADPFGGTHFGKDPGGYAVKLKLTRGRSFVGKVEFHPDDEQLRVYDTKNDGDTFYVKISYSAGGVTHHLGTYSAPGTPAVVDHAVKDFAIPEGAFVDLSVYDDVRQSDYIGGARGTAGAVA